jgi:hypothetical protein
MPRCVRAHAVFELGKAGGIAARPSFRAMALTIILTGHPGGDIRH